MPRRYHSVVGRGFSPAIAAARQLLRKGAWHVRPARDHSNISATAATSSWPALTVGALGLRIRDAQGKSRRRFGHSSVNLRSTSLRSASCPITFIFCSKARLRTPTCAMPCRAGNSAPATTGQGDMAVSSGNQASTTTYCAKATIRGRSSPTSFRTRCERDWFDVPVTTSGLGRRDSRRSCELCRRQWSHRPAEIFRP